MAETIEVIAVSALCLVVAVVVIVGLCMAGSTGEDIDVK